MYLGDCWVTKDGVQIWELISIAYRAKLPQCEPLANSIFAKYMWLSDELNEYYRLAYKFPMVKYTVPRKRNPLL